MDILVDRMSSKVFNEFAVVLTPNGFCAPDGSVSRTPVGSSEFETIENTAYVVRVGPNVALGRFLTDALPFLWSWRGDNGDGTMAGPMPTPAQLTILRRVGLLNNGYFVIGKLTKFDLIVSYPATLEYYVSDDSRVLKIMDRLRGPVSGVTRVAIISDLNEGRLEVQNWTSLTVALLGWRITPLDLSKMSFADLAETLASAELLILADPRQAGLAGLCSPGAQIVEIIPEGFTGRTLQAFCTTADLKWTSVILKFPINTSSDGVGLESGALPSFESAISALGETLSSLGF